jgi:hypothetical protein
VSEQQELAARLGAPFDPQDVDFRPQGKPNANDQGRVVAYVDARTVQDRLDEVFGPEGWSFSWEPLVITNTIQVVRGTITAAGVSKSDVGDAGDTEPSKSAVSDAFKRAAVQWGIGRYLYGMGASYVKTKQQGNSWVPADGEVACLRSKLPAPNHTAQGANGRQQPAQRVTAANGGVSPATLAIISSRREALGWSAEQVRELWTARGLPARLADFDEKQGKELVAALDEKLGEVEV